MTSEYDWEKFPSDLEMEKLSESNQSEAQHVVNGLLLSPDHNKNKLSPRPPSRSSGANTMTNKESGGDWDGFAADLENNLLFDSNTFETQDKVKGVPLSPNRSKRKLRQTRRSGSIGARKRQLVIGQLSASQQPEQEGKKESLEERMEKSVPNAIKILNDRLDRRINNMKDVKFLKAVSSLTGADFDLIQKLWPARSALDYVKIELKEISKKSKEIEGTGLEVMKKILLDIQEKIKYSDVQRQEDSSKVNNLQKLFITEGVCTDTLRRELYAAFPWLPREEIETNGPTREQLQKEIFAKDEVNVSDFPGLQEALEKTAGRQNVPTHLEHIAINIEKARGAATEPACYDIQLLVCAAIYEMEVRLEDLDKHKLARWAAVLNKARERGFYVEFAENQFWKNLYAFFGWFNIV